MLAFVDESGDLGMSLRPGSSECFTVAAVIFQDRAVALACNEAISHVRDTLRFHTGQEFKFNKCKREYREAFLRAVAPFGFLYHAVVLNKAQLTGQGFQYKGPLYKFPIKLLFQNAQPLLDRATVYIDTSGSRDFTRGVGGYVRKHMMGADGEERVAKVKAERSHSNNLVQLADMVCGAVARSFKRDKPDRLVYRGIVRAREVRVQFWPK